MTVGLLLITHSPLASALRECVLHVFADGADAVVAVDIRSDDLFNFVKLRQKRRGPLAFANGFMDA